MSRRKPKQLPPLPKSNGKVVPQQTNAVVTPPVVSNLRQTTPNKPKVITPVVSKPIVYQYKRKLTFSPYAWAKLLFMRDKTNNEVGAYGITTPDNLLHVIDLAILKQEVSVASTLFDDEGIADFFDAQVELGRNPTEFARVWVHTHPGNCAKPSMTDYETFGRAFGVVDWAVMFILANDGATSCELRFNIGPKASLQLPITIDYSKPFLGTDYAAWEKEYTTNVNTKKYAYTNLGKPPNSYGRDLRHSDADMYGWEAWYDQEYSNITQRQSADAVEVDVVQPEDLCVCDFCTRKATFDHMLICDECGVMYCPTCIQELDTREDRYICADCMAEIEDCADELVFEEIK